MTAETASSLVVRSRHSRSTQGYFNPLALDAHRRANERAKLTALYERVNNAERLCPTHSVIPVLKAQAQLLYRQVLAQELLRHYDLQVVKVPLIYETPYSPTPSAVCLSLPIANLDVPLPAQVTEKLSRFAREAPWMISDPWVFERSLPRARDLVQLWAVIEGPAPDYQFSKVYVAADRSAGRLYHLARHFSRVLPYRLARPNGSVAQYMLSNFAL